MSLGCIIEQFGDPLPPRIYDESTLSLSIDNQGIASLQISILVEGNINPITNPPFFNYPMGNAEFVGFLADDVPEKLPGTKYYEHKITARGIVK